MKGRRILVTGGAGLVGSRLVHALLKEQLKVRVLDTRYGALNNLRGNPNLEFAGIGGNGLRGGMADMRVAKKSVRDIDVVYHLAVNWDGASWKHTMPYADLFDVNIRGTLNLLEAAKSEGTKHFIFSSSVAVYGETQRTIGRKRLKTYAPVDEETVCKPEIWGGDPGPAYAVLKLTTEKLCLMYYHHRGLPVTIFRVEYVFVGAKELKDGANIHVDDVVKAFTLAKLNEKAYGQVFNVACKSPATSTQKVERLLGWRPLTTQTFLRT